MEELQAYSLIVYVNLSSSKMFFNDFSTKLHAFVSNSSLESLSRFLLVKLHFKPLSVVGKKTVVLYSSRNLLRFLLTNYRQFFQS